MPLGRVGTRPGSGMKESGKNARGEKKDVGSCQTKKPHLRPDGRKFIFLKGEGNTYKKKKESRMRLVSGKKSKKEKKGTSL